MRPLLPYQEIRLLANIDPDTPANRECIVWEGEGVGVSSSDKRKAYVDCKGTQKRTIRIKHKTTNEVLWEATAWFVWGLIDVQIQGALDADNNAEMLAAGPSWPSNFLGKYHLGPGNWLGTTSKDEFPAISYAYAIGRVQIKVRLGPEGITDIVPSDRWSVARRMWVRAWDNGVLTFDEADYAGEDDDSPDYAVDTDPGDGNEIFDLDVPGCSATLPGDQINHNAEAYMNFDSCARIKLGPTYRYRITGKTPGKWSYVARVNIDNPGSQKVDKNELKNSWVEIPDEPFYSTVE